MRRLGMVILGILLLGVCASSWAVELNLPPGKWWENPALVERLGLSEEQQRSIRHVVFDHARRMIDLTADVKRSELTLGELVSEEDFDDARVREAFAQFQSARKALESQRFELLLAVRGELTQEQWKMIQEARRDAMRRRGQQQGPMRRGERGQQQRRRPPGGGF